MGKKDRSQHELPRTERHHEHFLDGSRFPLPGETARGDDDRDHHYRQGQHGDHLEVHTPEGGVVPGAAPGLAG